MHYTNFEYMLGKDIFDVEDILKINLKKNSFKKNDSEVVFHSNKGFINEPYLNTFYNHLSIITNEDNKVQSITIHFRTIIDNSFYNLFNNKYGVPDSILIVENKKLESKITIKDKKGNINETLSKNTFDLKEGSFQEKPIYIIWKKKKFQIKAFLRYEQNISQITFNNYVN